MRKFALLLIALTTVILSCNQQKFAGPDSLLIKNAIIIDGSGSQGRTGDVLIINDTIVVVGNTAAWRAAKEVDALGLVLAPGFIDLHAHGNPLGENGGFENFLSQGVTTVCLGMDGFSAGDISGWIHDLSNAGLATNIIPFVGHSTIREVSLTGYSERPVAGQLLAMNDLLAEALDLGYFGMSTGLEYLPGGLADTEELHGLARVVGAKNSLLMSHLRNEDNDQIENSLAELIGMGKYCQVHVSHIKVVYGKGKERAKEILSVLASARNTGINITADMYPYTASYTGIGILFPKWAKAPADYEVIKATQAGTGGIFI